MSVSATAAERVFLFDPAISEDAGGVFGRI